MSSENKKSKKTEIDEISKETQRLVSNSEVHLPYHKSKQKSLKDFLNRQKNSVEYHASITGSKKLLQKAWELIENKEQNVEKFYNEDSSQNEDSKLSSGNNKSGTKKNITLSNHDDTINCDKVNDIVFSFNDNDEDIVSHETSLYSEKSVNEKVKAQQNSENVKNNLNSSKQQLVDEVEVSELDCSSNSKENKSNIIDTSDEEEEEFSITMKRRYFVLSESSDDENYLESKSNKSTSDDSQLNIFTQEFMSSNSDEFKTQQSEIEEDRDFISDLPNYNKDNEDMSDLDCSSGVRVYNDDENDLKCKSKKLIDDALKALIGEPQPVISTQELMSLCSGEFKTQESQEDQDIVSDVLNDNEDIKDMSNLDGIPLIEDCSIDENDLKCKKDILIADALKALIGEPEPIISTQELMKLCSGEFKTQESQEDQDIASDVLNDNEDIKDMSNLDGISRIEDCSIDENDLKCKKDILLADALKALIGEPEPIISTQELMKLCSGEFKTQESQEDQDLVSGISDDKSIKEMVKLTNSNDLKALIGKSQPNMSTQELKSQCSGELKTQESEIQKEQNYISDFSQDETSSIDEEIIDEMPKLISMKDFFNDEAELSESDWSSDDEENLINDKLEEEIGDKDTLDENVVKDELDKIYMRQLMDDDQQQVNALKDMLLEDGNLHSDSGRKRKFQWDEAGQIDAVYKKPLFSDNEDEDNNLSDDEVTEQWRIERMKRESYLSLANKDDESSDIICETPIPVVKKTTYVLPSKSFVRGSFIKRSNANQMANSLMYMNRNSLITSNEIINVKYEKMKQIESITTITDNVCNKPFSYSIKTDKKLEMKNIRASDLTNINKNENNTSFQKPCTSEQLTKQSHQTKNIKSNANSILKQLE